jgi:hypothetical protein
MALLAERLLSARLTTHRATSQRQVSPHTALQSHDSYMYLITLTLLCYASDHRY